MRVGRGAGRIEFELPKISITRGVPDKVLPQIPDQRYVACPDGNRLVDLATGKYYVPERWLVERINAKLEQAAKITEGAERTMGYGSPVPDEIRTLKENL